MSFIDQLYKKETDLKSHIKVTNRLQTSDPKLVIDTFLQRLQLKLDSVRAEKTQCIEQWQQICQVNFTKSLDHRSFFFKEAQKKHLQSKKQIDELRRQQTLPGKNLNQLKGGVAHSEFYCTYSSF